MQKLTELVGELVTIGGGVQFRAMLESAMHDSVENMILRNPPAFFAAIEQTVLNIPATWVKVVLALHEADRLADNVDALFEQKSAEYFLNYSIFEMIREKTNAAAYMDIVATLVESGTVNRAFKIVFNALRVLFSKRGDIGDGVDAFVLKLALPKLADCHPYKFAYRMSLRNLRCFVISMFFEVIDGKLKIPEGTKDKVLKIIGIVPHFAIAVLMLSESYSSLYKDDIFALVDIDTLAQIANNAIGYTIHAQKVNLGRLHAISNLCAVFGDRIDTFDVAHDIVRVNLTRTVYDCIKCNKSVVQGQLSRSDAHALFWRHLLFLAFLKRRFISHNFIKKLQAFLTASAHPGNDTPFYCSMDERMMNELAPYLDRDWIARIEWVECENKSSHKRQGVCKNATEPVFKKRALE